MIEAGTVVERAAEMALSAEEAAALQRRKDEFAQRDREFVTLTAEREAARVRWTEEDARREKERRELDAAHDSEEVRARRRAFSVRCSKENEVRAAELARWEREDQEREERMDEEDARRERELARFVPDLVEARRVAS